MKHLPESKALSTPPVVAQRPSPGPVTPEVLRVDAHLRARHTAFSDRAMALAALLLTVLACVAVYALGHWSTSGLGLERDLRQARSLETLGRFERRIARSDHQHSLRALYALQELRLHANAAFTGDGVPSAATVRDLSTKTQELQPQAHPQDAEKVLGQLAAHLASMGHHSNAVQSREHLSALLQLAHAISAQLEGLGENTSETRARLQQTRRLLVARALAAPETAGNRASQLVALDPALLGGDSLLREIRDAAADPQAFVNALLGWHEDAPTPMNRQILRARVHADLPLEALVLPEHARPGTPGLSESFQALADFSLALAQEQGVQAVSHARQVHALWGNYPNVIAFVNAQLTRSATPHFSFAISREQQAQAAEGRRWLLAQRTHLDNTAEARNTGPQWAAFVDAYLAASDPAREPPSDSAHRALVAFLEQPVSFAASPDGDAALARLLDLFEAETAAGNPVDFRLSFMINLVSKVYQPLSAWVAQEGTQERGGAPAAAFLEEAHLHLWELLQSAPAALGSVRMRLRENDTLWEFHEGPLRGVQVQGDDDLYGDRAPSASDISTDMRSFEVMWQAVEGEEHFLLLQELGAALWLAQQTEVRRTGTSPAFTASEDGARLGKPQGAGTGTLSGKEAFAAILLEELPLPIKLGVQAGWQARRERLFESRPQVRRGVLFDNFDFARPLAASPAFLKAFDVTPVLHSEFYTALEACRAEIGGVLGRLPGEATARADGIPAHPDLQRAIATVVAAGAPSAQPLLDLVRGEALLRECIQRQWYPPTAGESHALSPGQDLTQAWRDILITLVPVAAFGKAEDGRDLLRQLGLEQQLPSWDAALWQTQPVSVVQTARSALAAWSFLGARYGEGSTWRPTPFNQRYGEEYFARRFQENQDAYTEVYGALTVAH